MLLVTDMVISQYIAFVGFDLKVCLVAEQEEVFIGSDIQGALKAGSAAKALENLATTK